MRLVKNKNYKVEKISFRLTTRELNLVMTKALLLTEGNISEYILYAALNFKPDMEDLEEAVARPLKN